MNPRKGLIREGYRTYLVPGPNGTWAIDRDRPARFYVRPRDWPRNGFFAMAFNRLRQARLYAEQQAGVVSAPFYPYPEVPTCLRRWKPEGRVAA